MEKNKNNLNLVTPILDKIKITLYFIAVLLLINVVIGIINTNNTGILREYSNKSGENTDNNDNSDDLDDSNINIDEEDNNENNK